LSYEKQLRSNMTIAERALWHVLRAGRTGYKFRRQAPIGPYIVDFAALSHRLIIEVDGGQHAESAKDRERDAWLLKRGYRVMRFWNHEVLRQRETVLQSILEVLREGQRGAPGDPLSPTLSPTGERGDPSRGVAVTVGEGSRLGSEL
jgi:very-short-patch-repair endonuclease